MASPLKGSSPSQISQTASQLNQVAGEIKKSGRFAVISDDKLLPTNDPAIATKLKSKEFKTFIKTTLQNRTSSELKSLEKGLTNVVKYYQTKSARTVQKNINKVINPESFIGKIISKVISVINRNITMASAYKKETISEIKHEIALKSTQLEILKLKIYKKKPEYLTDKGLQNKLDHMTSKQLKDLLASTEEKEPSLASTEKKASLMDEETQKDFDILHAHLKEIGEKRVLLKSIYELLDSKFENNPKIKQMDNKQLHELEDFIILNKTDHPGFSTSVEKKIDEILNA